MLEMSKNDAKTHVLVVDDEPIISELLAQSLTSIGYKVSVAHNGLEALRSMIENNFGMVLMDIEMPEMDGIKTIQFLRKCEQGKHHSLTEHHELAQSLHTRRVGTRVPVVAVTGNMIDRDFLLQVGMDEYISKPFKFNSIYEALERFCVKSGGDTGAERRRHTRHPATENGIVLFHQKAGLVLDISDGGMSINLLDNVEPLPDKWKVNFYCTATDTKIEGLQLKLIREEAKKESKIGIETQIVGSVFYKPTSRQLEQIRSHICKWKQGGQSINFMRESVQ